MKKFIVLLLLCSSVFSFGQVKISALPAASTLSGSELIETVQSGTSKKTTTQAIANLYSLGYTAEDSSNKSTDGTFAANSDELYPSQKAAKTYIDGKIPKVYAVRLTQSGTADPTASTGYNSTGATATIIRTGTGYGRITFSGGVMTSGKTIVSLSGTGSGGYSDPKLFTHQISAVNQINLGAFRASDQTAEDDWVLDLTITVYP